MIWIVYPNELYHHGIKGQKWGVKNGPPYPLEKSQRPTKRNTQGMSELLWDAAFLATSVAITVAPIAIDSMVRKHKAKKEREAVEKNSNDKRFLNEREDEEIDPETGLYLTKKKMTEEENMERINPSFNTKYEAFKVNCTACTVAMELRERGFDVHAGTDGDELVARGGTSVDDRKKWYTKENNPYDNFSMYTTASKKNVQNFKDAITKQKKSRGEILLNWEGGGGHSIFYKVNNGKLTLYDAQANKKYTGEELDELIDKTYQVGFVRLDNATMRIQFLKENNYIC